MKKLLFVLLIIESLSSFSQLDKSLSKIEWKSFVKEFNHHLEVANDFFKDQYDLEKRDELLGAPTSKITLVKSTSNFFDEATYSMFYKYEFSSEQLAKQFLESLKSNMSNKLQEGYVITTSDEGFSFHSIENEDNHTSASVYGEGKTIYITFSPALNKELPMDY